MTPQVATSGSAIVVGEAHHRFANSLQAIVSATNVILRSGGCNPQACERIQALQQQVVALAEVNRSLCGPYGPNSISTNALRRLCTSLAASFERADARFMIAVSGAATSVDACRTVLLLIGELLMNALKHGPIERRPAISIDLTLNAEQCLLQVCSNTAGQAVKTVRPRIADEIVIAAGGLLAIDIDGDSYRVTATLPGA